MPTVGTSPIRKEGVDKVTGRTLYGDDLRFPGMLHGRTLRSPVARARLRGVRFDPAFDWTGIVRVTAEDIPGKNLVALIVDDQPALAADEIRHHSEPVALIAGDDPERLEEAMRHVQIDLEPLPAALTLDEAADDPEAVQKRISIDHGDVERAFAEADLVVEGEYRTGHQEQLYIEPMVIIAVPKDGGGVEIHGSMQCPYYVHKALQKLLDVGPTEVVVVQSATGGGFGGKEEYPSMIASHAALLARKAGRPVKILYGRQEDIAATTKRHPTRIRYRTAVKKDGTLLGADVDIVVDGGAYVTLTPVVLSRAALHCCGAYRWPAARVRARAVRTHTPPNGAFRGFGAPQALFAIEAHMEKIAAALGMAPHELRRKNVLREGDATPTGGKLRWSVGASDVLEDVLRRSNFEAKRAVQAHGRKRRGVGLSLFLHGAGFTGAGEVRLASVVGVEVAPDGKVRVLTSSTEIGQGTRTILAQMAADGLGARIEDVTVSDPDTSRVPDSGPTVASRTTMVVGGLVARAAREIAVQLCGEVARRHLLAPEEVTLSGGIFRRGDTSLESLADAAARAGGVRTQARYQPPPGIAFDETTYQGDAYPCYAWSANVAEVEVDLDTGDVTVLDFWSSVDPGKVVHPIMAEGQIEGGIVQGIGYGTIEEMKMERGRYQNDRMSTYIIPTALDAPPIHVSWVEKPHPYGPFGAKGIGELPIDGPAPAIAAAIFHATGVLPSEIPATPERLLEALSR